MASREELEARLARLKELRAQLAEKQSQSLTSQSATSNMGNQVGTSSLPMMKAHQPDQSPIFEAVDKAMQWAQTPTQNTASRFPGAAFAESAAKTGLGLLGEIGGYGGKNLVENAIGFADYPLQAGANLATAGGLETPRIPLQELFASLKQGREPQMQGETPEQMRESYGSNPAMLAMDLAAMLGLGAKGAKGMMEKSAPRMQWEPPPAKMGPISFQGKARPEVPEPEMMGKVKGGKVKQPVAPQAKISEPIKAATPKEPWDYHGNIGTFDLDSKFTTKGKPDGLDLMDYLGLHVGTQKAAKARMKFLTNEGVKGKKNITALSVTINRPFGNKIWTEDALREAIKEYGGIGNDKQVAQNALAKMQSEGYDGILYRNLEEDPGSISKIVFDKKQVKVLPVPPDLAAKYGKEPPKVAPEPPPPLKTPPVASMEAIGAEKQVFRPTKEDMASLRESIPGMKDLPPKDVEHWTKVAKIAEENQTEATALETADRAIKTNRPLSRPQVYGITTKTTKLWNEFDEAISTSSELAGKGNKAGYELEMKRAGAIRDQIQTLTDALEKHGTSTARDLNFLKIAINREDFSLERVMKHAQAAKGEKLTLTESKRIIKVTKELETAKNRIAELEKSETARIAEIESLRAERILKRERKTASSKEKILKDREGIKKQLRDMGFRVNDVTGVTAEGSYLIGRLAATYAQEGLINVNSVVRKIMEDIPDILESDVRQSILARDPARRGRLRSDATKRMGLLKKQAKLINELENEKALSRSLLNDLTDVAYKTAGSDRRLENILKTIGNLREQLKRDVGGVIEKTAKNAIPEDIRQAELQTKVAREHIAQLKRLMETKNQIADLQNQLKTGEFKSRPVPVKKPVSPELENARIDAQILKKRIKAEIDAMQKFNPVQETINTLRTAKTVADISAIGRQAAVLLASNPTKAPVAIVQSFRAMFSKYKFEQIDQAMRSRPLFHKGHKAGLELTEMGASLSKREEFFQSRLLERIPVLREIVGASNRHMNTFLNVMRTGAFDDFARKYPNATPAELKAYSRWINVNSGRGDWGAGGYNVLSKVFFAPRFTMSRVQTPYMVFSKLNSPRVRMEIAKDMAKFIGMTGTIIGLAKLGGLDIGTNPREADWGKIKVGNTTVDIFAGFQQPARMIARMVTDATDRAGVTGKQYRASERELDPREMMMLFAQYRLAPHITTPLELWTGETAVGEKITPQEASIRALIPLVAQDVWEAWKDKKNLEQAGMAAVLSGIGLGINTYEKKHRTPLPGDIGRKKFLEDRLKDLKVEINPFDSRSGDKKPGFIKRTDTENKEYVDKRTREIKEIEDILKRGVK